LPFEFADYRELVDWTGRAVHPDKRGAIPEGVKGMDLLKLFRTLQNRLRGTPM